MSAMDISNPKLPNGATILAIDYVAGVVLATTDRDYVTWEFPTDRNQWDPDGPATFWGHYFGNDILEAQADYRERVNRTRPGYQGLVI